MGGWGHRGICLSAGVWKVPATLVPCDQDAKEKRKEVNSADLHWGVIFGPSRDRFRRAVQGGGGCILLLPFFVSPSSGEVMMVHCAGCERPILDRFLLNVLDRAWHIKCVQCCECKCNLTEKCFSREGKLYCKNDFFR